MTGRGADQKFLKYIEMLCEWSGRASSLLLIPLTILCFFEVVMRYLFNSPTIWIWDINIQITGAIVVLGMAYGLIHNSFVRMDILVARLSRRKRAILDLLTAPIVFFGLGVLLKETIQIAWFSAITGERWSSLFAPPIYPLKIILAMGLIFLLLGCVGKFIRDAGEVLKWDGGEEK